MAIPIALQNYLTMANPQYSSRMTGNDAAQTAGSIALGIGSNALSMKQLTAQLELEQKKLDELVKARDTSTKLSLLNSGLITNENDRKRIINEMIGKTGALGNFPVLSKKSNIDTTMNQTTEPDNSGQMTNYGGLIGWRATPMATGNEIKTSQPFELNPTDRYAALKRQKSKYANLRSANNLSSNASLIGY